MKKTLEAWSKPRRGMDTPWGHAETCELLADGIASVTTAGHGGFHLSSVRASLMPFDFFTFAGGDWYEEDEDVCAVIVAFPDLFSGQQVASAVKQVRATANHSPEQRWAAVRAWLESAGGAETRGYADNGQDGHADLWRQGSMFRSSKGWTVHFTRVGDGAREVRLMADYPAQAMYSDAELASMPRG